MMELDSEAIQTSKSKSTCQRQPWGKRTSTSKPQGSYVLNPQRVPAESFQAWQSMEDASDQTSIAQKVTRKQTTDSIPADGRAFFSLTNKRPSSYRLSSRNINYSDIESKRSKVNLRKPPCDIGPGDSQSPKNIEGTSNLHEIHSAPLSWTPRIKLGYPESLTEGEKLKNFENSGNLRPRAQSFHPGRIVPEIPYNYSTQDSMESTTEEQNDLVSTSKVGYGISNDHPNLLIKNSKNFVTYRGDNPHHYSPEPSDSCSERAKGVKKREISDRHLILTSEKAGAEQLGSESLRERQGLSRAKKSNSHESLFLTQNGFSDSETESLKTLESREESPSLTKRTENPGIKQKRFTFSKKAQRFDSSPQERDTTVPNYGNSNHDELFGASYLRRSSSNVQRLNKPNDFITASVNISEYNTEVKLLNELVGKTSSSLLLRLRESLKESEKNKFNALKKHEEMATYKQKVKNVLQKISLKKSSMDENFGVVRRQVTEQIMLERLNSESCSKEISQLREQIKTSLKTFEDLSAQNFETFDNSIEENMKNGAKQQHSRRALELINDLNEDRRKKQSVIEILRNELETKTGQLVEMRERTCELENATLSQAEAANKTLEKFRIEGIDIQNKVKGRCDLIFEHLQKKESSEKELQDCQIKATSLQSEVLSLNKTSIELSQELRYVKKRIQDGDNLREMETQKNEKNIEKLDKLRNEFVAAQSSLSEIKMSERNAIENLEKKDEENLRTIAENAQLKVQKINLEQRVSILQEDLDKLHQVHEDSIRSFHDQKYFASRFQTLQSELNALQINHHALKEEHEKVLKLKTDLQVKNESLMLEVEKSLSHQEALEIKVKDYNHEIASQKNLIEKLKYQGSEFEANTRDLSSKLSQAQHDFASAEKEMFSIEKEAARLRLFEVQCKELEEKVARLLEAQYKDEKNRKDLQERLDFNQERWEDLKSREDLAMGQVTVLQEKLTEAKGNQTSMNRELRGLKEQLADLKAQNNELKLVGESRRSREVIEELNVRLREELSLRNKLEDKIQNFEQDILSIKKAAQDEANEKEKFFLEEKHQIKKDLASKESEVKLRKERESLTKSEIEELRRGLKLEEEKNVDLGWITNIYQEEKRMNLLLENSLKDAETLKTSYNDALNEIGRLRQSLDDLKQFTNEKLSESEASLQESQRKALEVRKEAVATSRSNAIATVEKKYEVLLMHANNETKKTGKKLSETESRLLAMSAELAKARGKPSLEEIFSSSDQTELPSHGAGSNATFLMSSGIIHGNPEKKPSCVNRHSTLLNTKEETKSRKPDINATSIRTSKRLRKQSSTGIEENPIMNETKKLPHSNEKSEEALERVASSLDVNQFPSMRSTKFIKKLGKKKITKQT